jgi:ketosteroid isomerase-like protein
MEKVATGWNHGNARIAADCFSDDAIYSSPPSGKFRRGRDQLFEFFGGAAGRPAPMHMEWHHFAYKPDTEIGFGEYTFRYKDYQAHGIVIVRTRNGEIRNWREYEIPSKLTFEQFVGANAF